MSDQRYSYEPYFESGGRESSMKALDILVFVPLIPAVPVIATWYLPWETWIPKKLPKSVIGPYLLYCAFGAWYFALGRWCIALVSVLGIIVSVLAVVESKKKGSEQNASPHSTPD